MANVAKITPADFVEKWQRRMRGSTEDMRRGASLVSVAPSSLAVAKKEKMKARLIDAIDKGIWAKQLSAYSLEQWRTDFSTTGVDRISSGVDKAKPKMDKFASWLLPAVSDVQGKVAAMPDVTIEDSIARATTWIREMSKRKYKA